MKKFLFINFGGLGDEILFLPTIQAIKKEFPNSHITLALEQRSSGIKDLTTVIDNMIFANIKERNKYLHLLFLLFKIWRNRYDIVISSGSNNLISIFLFLTGIKKRYGYNTGFLSKILLSQAVNLNKNQYAVNMYQDLISPLTKIKILLPELNIVKKTIEQNSILVHPGVSQISIKKGIIKTIPATKWAEVIDLLSNNGKKVYLIGGPDDRDCIETIVNKVSSDKFINLCGKTRNLKELAEIISSKEIFLCSDSAPLHIAVALKIKTFVIFGPTDDKKLVPQSKDVIAIKSTSDCPLRPCLWEKRHITCEKLDCLDIKVEEIVKKIMEQ